MNTKRRKKRRWLIAAGVIIFLLLLFIWLMYDSSANLQVSRYEAASEKLPESFDGFTIVQLSDLHGAQFGSGLAQKVRQIMTDAGVKYLSNEFVSIDRGEDSIILGGVEDPLAYADMIDPPELARRMNEADPAAFKVLLGHRNYWMEEYPDLPVDLILSGHAHGGLVRIPGVGGVIGTDRSLFPDYDAGEYDNGAYTLIVSRGLGNSVPVPWLLNRPEIVVVTLRTK